MTSSNPSLLEYMKTRRSVPAKTMGGPGPSEDEILQMVSIAARVPDHGKLAPWRFISFGEAARTALTELISARAVELNPNLNEEAQALEKNRLFRAPTVIGLISSPVPDHPKVPVWEQELSCGAAGMNLLIAANGLGYDAQWITEWVAFDEALAPHFGVGKGERLAGLFYIGTKTIPKTERARPELGDVFRHVESLPAGGLANEAD